MIERRRHQMRMLMRPSTWPEARLLLQPTGAEHAPNEPDGEERGERETDHREEVNPEDLRPPLHDRAEDRGRERSADGDHGDPDPVEDDVHPLDEVVQPL